MALGDIRRRMTKHVKHRRNSSTESSASDHSSDSSASASMPRTPKGSGHYTPHSARYSSNISPPIITRPLPPMMARTATESSLVSMSFMQPRAAPVPPAASPAFDGSDSTPSLVSADRAAVSHAPPPRAPVTPPPAPPPRAMPPWRASLINLAEAYAPIPTPPGDHVGPTDYVNLIIRLHDANISERQALGALRTYVDGVHAAHRFASPSSYNSDLWDGDSDSGSAR